MDVGLHHYTSVNILPHSMVPRLFVCPRFHSNSPQLLTAQRRKQCPDSVTAKPPSAIKDTVGLRNSVRMFITEVNLLTYSTAIRNALHLTAEDRNQSELQMNKCKVLIKNRSRVLETGSDRMSHSFGNCLFE